MKKSLKISILAVVFMLCVAFSLISFTYKTDAAVVTNTAFTDPFDSASDELSEKWIVNNGATLKTDYRALRINRQVYDWGSILVNRAYKTDYATVDNVRVEMTLQRYRDTGMWFAFAFGLVDTSYGFPYSSGAFIMTDQGSDLMYQEATGILGRYRSLGIPVVKNGVKVKLIAEFESKKAFGETSENFQYNYDLTFTVYNADTNELVGTKFLPDVTMYDGYFGFNSASISVDIYDFNIYENGSTEPTYKDDFTTSKVSYSTRTDESAEWLASSKFSESEIVLGNVAKLDLGKGGSSALYSVPYVKPSYSSLYKAFSLTAEFSVGEMKNGTDSGFIFGTDENGNGGTFVGVRARRLNYTVCTYDMNNKEEVTLIGTFNRSPKLSAVLNVYCDGTFDCTIGDITVKGQGSKIEGYIGFITPSTGESVKGLLVDNFVYSTNIYQKRENPDSLTSFDDTTEKEIVEGITSKSFYLSPKEWFMGSGVKLPLYSDGNGFLQFVNAGDFSCVAPKKKYNDFILKFDLTFAEVYSGSMFGLEFAKDLISEAYTNSQYVGLQNVGGVTTNYVSSNILSTEGVTTKPITGTDGSIKNIFTEDGKINVMFVVKNGSISIFVKDEDEEDVELSNPVVTFNDLVTDGYPAFFAVNLSCYLDNLAFINLDYDYFSDDYLGSNALESFRYDFKNGTKFDALDLNGQKLEKGGLTIKASSIYTKQKVGASLYRIKLNEANENFTIKHGDTQILADVKGKILTVSSKGTSIGTIDLGEDFVFDGALFEIEETFNNIEISYVSGDKPLMAVAYNKVSFLNLNNFSFDKIEISTNGKISVSQFSQFNLDMNQTIVSSVVAPKDVRVPRTAIQDLNKSGCGSNINGLLILAPVMILASLAIVILRKKESK